MVNSHGIPYFCKKFESRDFDYQLIALVSFTDKVSLFLGLGFLLCSCLKFRWLLFAVRVATI